MEYKCPEPQFITLITAGKDVLFGEPVALRVCIAFANAAVIAVVLTVIGKFDQPTDIDIVSVVTDPYHSGQFKEIIGGCGSALSYEFDPLAALQFPGQTEFVDQRFYFLFSFTRSHMFFP